MLRSAHEIFRTFGDSGARFIECLKSYDVDACTLEILSHPASVFHFSLPLRLDNGELHFFSGFRVRYNDLLGPTKGGIRFHPGVSESEMISLGFRLTIKCAANGLPFGGSNGGVAVDPKILSRGERERLSRSYVNAVADHVGPDRDILSPDLGTDQTVMAWMSDQYNTIARAHVPEAVNGKPPVLGGIVGRRTATARGAHIVMERILSHRGENLTGRTVVIQGFGNVGGELALLLFESGCRVVALSDSRGAICHRDGLDISALKSERANCATLVEALKNSGCAGEVMDPNQLWEVEADILIPAALGGQITPVNAEKIRARYIFELANGPTSAEADSIMDERKVVLVPDIIANAGGAIVSSYEGIQNRQSEVWSESQVSSRLCTHMTQSADEMMAVAKAKNVPYRIAAYIMAISRLDEAAKCLYR